MPPRSYKSAQCDNLYRLISTTGVNIMLYTFCSSRHLKCCIIKDNSHYAECVYCGRSCNTSGVPLSSGIFFLVSPSLLLLLLTCLIVNCIIKEKHHIKHKEEDIEAELIALQQQVSKYFACLARLYYQWKLMVDKGHKMVWRGLHSLDALKEVEREEAEAIIVVQLVGGFSVIDWSTIFKDLTDSALPTSSKAPGRTITGGARTSLSAQRVSIYCLHCYIPSI